MTTKSTYQTIISFTVELLHIILFALNPSLLFCRSFCSQMCMRWQMTWGFNLILTWINLSILILWTQVSLVMIRDGSYKIQWELGLKGRSMQSLKEEGYTEGCTEKERMSCYNISGIILLQAQAQARMYCWILIINWHYNFNFAVYFQI